MKNKTATEQEPINDGEQTKQTKATPNAPKIGIKSSSMWEFVYRYLDLVQNIGAKYDREFYHRYKQLVDYVYSKIALPDCEILDEYHIYEVTLNETSESVEEKYEYEETVVKYFQWPE